MTSRKNCRHTFLVVAGLALAGLAGCGGLGGKQQGQGPGVLTPSPSSLSFGNVQTGTSASLNNTLTNTGQSTLTISQITVTGTGFSISGITAPVTLTAGASATFSVQFSPTATGSVSGNVAFATDNGTVNLPLSGDGVVAEDVTASPSSVGFGSVVVGSAASQTVTLKNAGSDDATITAAAVTGSGFSVSGLTLPLTLTPNESSTFSVGFSPTVSGAAAGNVTLTISGEANLEVPLSGTGLTPATLTSNPTSLTFTNVVVGQSSTQTETITNTGGASAQITGIAATGAGFSVSGITLPVTLGPGQNVTFNVTFTPAAAGSFSGNVAVTSNAQNPTLNIPVAGTAVAAGDLTASPASISFGNVVVGNTASQTVTLKNTGGASVTVTAASISGAGFTFSGLTVPLTLGPNQSSGFNVTFTPAAAGAASGTMSLTVSGAANIEIPLAGTGLNPATLTANPTSLTFTNVLVGTNSTQTETIKNTGGASAQITAVAATGAGFSVSGITLPVTLGAGQTVSFNVTFTPPSGGTFSGNVAVTSNAQNPTLNIPVSGTAVTSGDLTASPASIAFGNVIVGDATSQMVTLQNTGGENVTVTAASITGAGFTYSGLTTPLTLAPSQSSTFSVTFDPASVGAVSGTMSLTVSGSANVGIPLSGTGEMAQGSLSVTSPINVGNVVEGTSGTATGLLTASTATVVVSSVALSGANANEFSITGLAFPLTVNVGSPVSFTVHFSPTATGAASATASFTSNASNSPTSSSLTGTGTSQPVHTVSLTWVASPTDGLTSYNVYRAVFASTCGAYSNIGSTGPSITAFTDNNVTDGTTYCYATTAVDPTGESGFSNVVQAMIPAP